MNRSVSRRLAKVSTDHQRNWEHQQHLVLVAYWSSLHETTGKLLLEFYSLGRQDFYSIWKSTSNRKKPWKKVTVYVTLAERCHKVTTLVHGVSLAYYSGFTIHIDVENFSTLQWSQVDYFDRQVTYVPSFGDFVILER